MRTDLAQDHQAARRSAASVKTRNARVTDRVGPNRKQWSLPQCHPPQVAQLNPPYGATTAMLAEQARQRSRKAASERVT